MPTYRVFGKRWELFDVQIEVEASSPAEALRLARRRARALDGEGMEAERDTTTPVRLERPGAWEADEEEREEPR